MAKMMSLTAPGRAVVAAAIAAVIGCTGAGPSVPSAPDAPGQTDRATGTAAPTGLPPATAVPSDGSTEGVLSTRVDLDADLAVSEIVLPEIGATLQATGRNGTTFTLTIPPDALVFAEEITMTPVAQLEGVPFAGGLVGAVDLQPDGLELMAQATLELDPADAVELDTEIAFRYRADGSEVLLAVMNPDPTKLTLPISHFSGAGVGHGSAEDLQRLAASQPTDIRDQIDAFIAEVMYEHGRRRITDQDFAELIELAGTRYYESVILPAINRVEGLVDTATIDEVAAIRRALMEYTAWERQLGLLGSELLKAEREALHARVDDILRRLFARIGELCIREHSIEAILMLIAVARSAELLSMPASAVNWTDCLRFEIRFRSRLVSSHAHEEFDGLSIGQLDMTQTLEAKVVGGASRGPEAYTELVFTHPPSDSGCGGTRMGYEGSLPSTFSVIRLWWMTESLEAGPDYAGDRPYRLRDVRLLYNVGTPQEIFNVCIGGQIPAGNSRHWQSAYLPAHKEDVFVGRSGVAGGHLAAGWELGSGALIASKVYQRSLPVTINECDFWPMGAFECTGGETLHWDVHEQTTIEIYHDPIVSP